MAKAKKQTANKMWGGHYSMGPAEVMAAINECIDVDKRLYLEDITASKAHAAMLAKQGIITARHAAMIRKGLDQILAEIDSGKFRFSAALEDIHMNVESRLAAIIGPDAGRLHTARSRNDQVAVDIRLWVRARTDETIARLLDLQRALTDQAARHADLLMPGFTHLQPAQPITFGHHLLAYVEMFGRDVTRFQDARARMNECPLGAAALAGTSFPIDRSMTSDALGFDRPMANSLDAVSDRDFAMEYMAAASITAVHLSRLSEEIVLWTSDGFGFIRLSEAFTTGSSIMPQKRNPDAAELIRGKAGALIGLDVQLKILMKGLPLAYNKDMQDSKPPVMKAADELLLMLPAMAGMIRDMKPRAGRMRAACDRGFLTATDLADALVCRFRVPFREAHHITGRIVRMAEDKGVRLDQLSLTDLQSVEPRLDASIYHALKPEAAVKSRQSLGGTAPVRVRAAAKAWQKKLGSKTKGRG